ncbi:MAG: hypothetical protein AAB293_06375 [Pseudomonadota bacterium]
MKLTDNEKRDIIKLFQLLQAIETMNDWQLVDESPGSSGDLLGEVFYV